MARIGDELPHVHLDAAALLERAADLRHGAVVGEHELADLVAIGGDDGTRREVAVGEALERLRRFLERSQRLTRDDAAEEPRRQNDERTDRQHRDPGGVDRRNEHPRIRHDANHAAGHDDALRFDVQERVEAERKRRNALKRRIARRSARHRRAPRARSERAGWSVRARRGERALNASGIGRLETKWRRPLMLAASALPERGIARRCKELRPVVVKTAAQEVPRPAARREDRNADAGSHQMFDDFGRRSLERPVVGLGQTHFVGRGVRDGLDRFARADAKN